MENKINFLLKNNLFAWCKKDFSKDYTKRIRNVTLLTFILILNL